MRVAVISDIHGNSHALDAVLQAIDGEGVEEIWCLGDLVGYGPRPNECCRTIAERADLCLAGNHDLGVLGRLDLEDFAPEAARSARWTQGVLEPQARAYLERLAPSAAREGVELFHGSPGDPVWEYVLSGEAALDALLATSAPLVLVGHSHVPLAIALGEDRLSGGVAPEGSEADLGAGRWLLNPGAVGQPRDGDPRACYLLYDASKQEMAHRRVAYDIASTQRKILAAGLPPFLATRLAQGA